MSCQRCAALQRDLDRMGRELEQARRKIDLLERALERIVNLCLDVKDRAAPVLGKRSGVPRGLWSRVKGRVDVADLVLRVLGG
jgi:hypothetical protein